MKASFRLVTRGEASERRRIVGRDQPAPPAAGPFITIKPMTWRYWNMAHTLPFRPHSFDNDGVVGLHKERAACEPRPAPSLGIGIGDAG